ncbi:sensor histidine kinase [Oleiharenicola sp. Vm1]|uniref:sensor histidine kinase n=1 Tax=Oleiharenicola sp. Vm1 TaxID=3398393 RepID=UPI0039F58669
MTPLARALLLSITLVGVFLVAAFSLQAWWLRQEAAARGEASERLGHTLDAALRLAPRPPEKWDERYRRDLSQLAQADVQLERAPGSPPAGPDNVFATVTLAGHPGWIVTAAGHSPTLERLRRSHQRLFITTIFLALLLGAVPLVFSLAGSRPAVERDTRAPWRRDAAGLEQFARLTVERGAALEREHDARRRAEEDLQVSRTLLDRSLEERIRLGRELHDNMSQTLYAVSLALESVRKKMTAAPAIEERLDQCVIELRRLNQEVRAYIRELEPENLRRESFPTALASTLKGLVPDHVALDQRFDPAALELIPAEHASELVNIVREAVSNSIRHGRAQRITLRAAHDAGALALAIADDGAGFAPDQTGAGGHGLANMRARAAALGGTLQVESAPGKGTRVLLTLPVASAS